MERPEYIRSIYDYGCEFLVDARTDTPVGFSRRGVDYYFATMVLAADGSLTGLAGGPDNSAIDVLDSEEVAALRGIAGPAGAVTVSTSVGQTIKSGPGRLVAFEVIAKGTSPTVAIYDNTTASGAKLIPDLNGSTAVGDWPAINVGVIYNFSELLGLAPGEGIAFSNGCHVVPGGTGTSTYRFIYR